ncbi:hypothetical protein BH18VER1_BH18VER1_13060 [soil metagenome]
MSEGLIRRKIVALRKMTPERRVELGLGFIADMCRLRQALVRSQKSAATRGLTIRGRRVCRPSSAVSLQVLMERTRAQPRRPGLQPGLDGLAKPPSDAAAPEHHVFTF